MNKLLLSMLAICWTANNLYPQCRADSVVNYRLVGSNYELASVEYFRYDDNDSVVFSAYHEYQGEKPVTGAESVITRKKVKGSLQVETLTHQWDPVKDTYYAGTKQVITYDKKGRLIREWMGVEERLAGEQTFVGESQMDIRYDKQGRQLEKTVKRWDKSASAWQNESRVVWMYEESHHAIATTQYWNAPENVWENQYKIEITNDSTEKPEEIMSYRFVKGAWVPYQRTEYGMDADGPLKYQLVQQWDGAKGSWVNQFYYVFQLNESGSIKTEVHLSWNGKDWKIDLTAAYQYNENGELFRILNDRNRIIMERYCRG